MNDGRHSTPPGPVVRSKTLEGMPAARPSRPPIVESARPRLTLTFSGPPLSFSDPAEEKRAPMPPLSLDEPPAALDAPASDGWSSTLRQSAPPPSALSGVSLPSPPILPGLGGAARFSRGTPSGSLPAVPGGADAYDLVERSRPSVALDLADEVAERYALGDFSGALSAAELLLGSAPDHEVAKHYAASSRERLEQFYRARLGSFERVARVAVDPSELRWLGLDHRAGFFLSRVDGMTSVEELLDLSGMPRLEALKTLVELLEMGAVALD